VIRQYGRVNCSDKDTLQSVNMDFWLWLFDIVLRNCVHNEAGPGLSSIGLQWWCLRLVTILWLWRAMLMSLFLGGKRKTTELTTRTGCWIVGWPLSRFSFWLPIRWHLRMVHWRSVNVAQMISKTCRKDEMFSVVTSDTVNQSQSKFRYGFVFVFVSSCSWICWPKNKS
jgi:hypothetical protein